MGAFSPKQRTEIYAEISAQVLALAPITSTDAAGAVASTDSDEYGSEYHSGVAVPPFMSSSRARNRFGVCELFADS